jgi:hypothetical protein
MEHAPQEVGGLYSKLRDDATFRQDWAERIDMGFQMEVWNGRGEWI